MNTDDEVKASITTLHLMFGEFQVIDTRTYRIVCVYNPDFRHYEVEQWAGKPLHGNPIAWCTVNNEVEYSTYANIVLKAIVAETYSDTMYYVGNKQWSYGNEK